MLSAEGVEREVQSMEMEKTAIFKGLSEEIFQNTMLA